MSHWKQYEQEDSRTTCLKLVKSRYKGEITRDFVDITKIIRQYYEQIFQKVGWLTKEMDISLETLTAEVHLGRNK